MTATFTISTSATPGARNVTITSAGGTSAANTFTVYGVPTITAINPPALATNGSNPVTVTGTGFVSGTTLAVDGGVTVQNLNIVNVTSLTASLVVPNTLGGRNVTATSPAGTSTNFAITVTGLQNFTPQSGLQGQSFAVDITGCFVVGQTSINVSGGGDVFVDNVVVGSDAGNPVCTPSNHATGTIHIGANAVPGVRNLSVTTPAGTIPSNVTFTVFALPVINFLYPAAGAQGSFIDVGIYGYGFIQGKVSVSAAGISVSNIQVSDVTFMTARFTIAANATLGAHSVSVTTDHGDTSNSVDFTVIGNPTVTSYSPTIGYAGGPMFMTFIGTNFIPGGTTVVVSGTNISADLPDVSSDFKTLKVKLTISAGATTGIRTVTISTGATGVSRNITINPTPAAPTLTSINPSSGPASGFVTATLTGTNFINGGTIVNVSGSGIEVGTLGFPTATTMTAFLILHDVIDLGSHTVSVTTAGGTTASVNFSVTTNPVISATHFTASHFAGPNGGAGYADGTGNAVRFNRPQKVWSDGTNLYIADSNNHTIRKVVIATGVTTTVAGTPGVSGTSNGVGPAALFNSPSGIWGDGTNLYVTENYNHAIRKIVLSTGAVSTFAGSITTFGNVNNAVGTSARFNSPAGICGDGTNLFVADSFNHSIRKIVISSTAVSTFAGSLTGVSGSTNATGTSALFNNPQGIFCDGTNLWVADTDNNEIRKITSGAVVSLWAGNLSPGSSDGTGQTGGTSQFSGPVALWGDGTNLYVADRFNYTIRKVAISNGQTSTLSGVAMSSGSADGTGSPGGTARFSGPSGIFGAGGNLYVSDANNNTIRKVVAASGATTTLVGSPGASGTSDGTGTAARFNYPLGLTGDGTNVFLTDENFGLIRKGVISSGAVTTLTGSAGPGSTDGDPTIAKFSGPHGIWTDGANLYIADEANSTIRKIVLATNVTSTLAGTAGSSDYIDATGTAARFSFPQGIWGDGANLYIADSGNNRIRKIAIPSAVVTTFAGTGNNGWNDGPPDEAFFNSPGGIWGDGSNLYVADSLNAVIRKIDMTTQNVTTLAGYPSLTGSLDGQGFDARFKFPKDIWGDRLYVYVTDDNNAVRRITKDTGIVTTISGGHVGSEDGLDSNSGFNDARGLWGNGSDIYVNDAAGNSIRKLTPATLAAPTLASISPASGVRNTTLSLTLTGANFIPGATTVAISPNTLITVTGATVTGPGTLIVNFAIASGAATGARTVTVTTSAGTSTTVSFTVN
jgi:hypothetical protein